MTTINDKRNNFRLDF